MMQANWRIICAVALIVVQLGVVSYSIGSNDIIAKTGVEYKFNVEPIDPYDIFRGRYVRFTIDVADGVRMASHEKSYAVIEPGVNGFSKISAFVVDRPEKDFIKLGKYGSLPIDRYYIDEKYAQAAEDFVRDMRGDDQLSNVYVTVRVKDGKPVVTGLFYDGQRIEDVLARQ